MRSRVLALAVIALMTVGSPASTHDHWINHGSYRNLAGEWCCGQGDCFALAAASVSISADGYVLRELNEVVPFAEAQPSPDGVYWRCKRPDGTRRCFFAPPANS